MRILSSPLSLVKLSSRPRRSYLLTVAAVSVVAVLLATSLFIANRASARAINFTNNQPQGCCSGQPANQVLYAPTTGLPGAGRAELVLNNNRQSDLVVTPTLYSKNGRPTVCDPITLKASEVRRIPVASLATGAGQGEGSAGGISLSYFGGGRELRSQVELFGEGHAGSVDVLVSAAGDYQSTVQEAVWWSPKGATATLALGNSSDSPIQVRLVFGSGEQQYFQIGPFATETVTHRRSNSTSSGAESVRLELSGAVGSLRAAGYVSSANKDYTSMIRFYDPQKVRQPNLYATNLRLKGSEPHIVLKNISNGPLTATPKFLPLAGNAGNPLELPPVELAAREAKEIDLTPLVEAAAARNDFEMVSVQVLNSGPTASLIGALSSKDKTSLVTYEAPLRDSGSTRRSTGTYPWKVDEDYSSLITITNLSQKQTRFAVQISYEGGQYIPDPQKLEAGATAVFDLNKIQREQIPDRDGQTIPQSVKEGQFVWSLLNGGEDKHLIGRLQLVSKANRASMSYSCELCCQWSFHSARVSPGSVNVMVGQSAQVEAQQNYSINCNGQFWLSPWYSADPDDFYHPESYGEWQSDDQSIATLSSTNLISTDVTGVAVGTTYVTVSWLGKRWFFNSSIDDCSWYYDFAVAYANVTVQVPQLTVNEVGFKNDYTITKWSGGYVIDSPDGTEPTWKSSSNPDYPVAYKAGAKPTIFAKFGISPSQSTGLTATIRVKNGSTVIATKNNVTVVGSSITVNDIAVTEVLESTVKLTTPTFTWEISFDGSNWNAISNSGPHKIYWTADAPIANPFQDSSGSTYSPLYDLALDKACGYVNGAADIRGGVTSGVSGDPQLYYNPGRPLPPGHPLTAYGQAAGFLCADYAYLLRGLLRSIGIDGTVKFMWAGPNSTTQRGYSLNNNPGLCQPGSPGTFCYSFRVLRPLKGDAPQNPHFSYHAAVYTNGLLYDAVYGDSYASPTFDETAFYNTPTQVQSSFYGFVQKTTFVCLHNQY